MSETVNWEKAYRDQTERVAELRRENAVLRKDVYQCPPTSENDYEGLKWCDACDELERENVALRKLVDHWYKLVPDNIRSAIKDAQEEGHP